MLAMTAEVLTLARLRTGVRSPKRQTELAAFDAEPRSFYVVITE